VGKPASGLRARRGSNPFPGAINMKLDPSSADKRSCYSAKHANNNFQREEENTLIFQLCQFFSFILVPVHFLLW
jgi:hypothetical protein